MPVDHRTELAAIKRFDQLVRYLRDRMGWPIESEDFEEITFEYTPEELGIDPKNAAKIQEIKRLRPLAAAQPWGIFFVKFEPKRLPVVALRRVLSQVALKKRASANSAERAAWAADDLLFVSNYGECEERQISFAHFSSPADGRDLPTLKVLGWDNLDTALHLDAVARELSENLAWPKNDKDAEAWRRQWRSAFTIGHREVITKSQELSIRLADLARAIRDRIGTALAIETEGGPLTRLMKAFQASLVHDMDAAGFADMYAQTIAYGLLSARIADPHKKTADDFAGHMRTNPFLRELMETFLKVGGRKGKAGGPGIDFDELGVGEVVALLDAANMEAVIRDFGDRNPQEDPVIHFYELFLHEYDAKKRVQRGVFYTPRPVVSYIVSSVGELLRTEFGLEDGLADTATWSEMAKRHGELRIPEGVPPDQDFVQILDPATGTGTFLVEVIHLIHRTLVAKWQKQGKSTAEIEALWNQYVPAHLLTRLHGYELLMAPYAIAHLKIGLKLYETGYHFGSEERARVYLTNALEPAQDFSGTFEFAIPALAHEAQAVNKIKREHRFTVVIGNPPYSGISANMSEAAQNLVAAYKIVDGQPLNERKHWLQDDYVKFFRLSQLVLEDAHVGALGLITNHAYLDNPTFRGMRQNLLAAFSTMQFCDLHGSAKKANIAPKEIDDQNVFDIQQGVAITVASILPTQVRRAEYASLWGTRAEKYEALGKSIIHHTGWSSLYPETPYYFFVPKNFEFQAEYEAGWRITEVMPTYVNGIVTARDAFVVDFEDAPIRERVTIFLNPELSDDKVKSELGLSENYAWRVHDAREELRLVRNWPQLITNILYRPFDIRRIIYHRSVVWRTRSNVMHHMLAGPNLGLCTNRQVNGDFHHACVTRCIINDCTLSLATKERTYIFPLFLYPDDSGGDLISGHQRRANVSEEFMSVLSDALGDQAAKSIPPALTPENLWNYAYSILHSPSYRRRYAEFLKIDFPRLAIPGDLTLFRELARLGGELIDLHLLESAKLRDVATDFVGDHACEIEKVSWSLNTVWLDKAQTSGFRGVPEAVWKFHIGGYQVCEKWLKDRKGRTLTKDDIDHYHKIVVALNETIRLMGEIDEIIERHGGWPGAFASAGQAAGETERAEPDSSADVVAVAVPHRAPVPPRVAAEPVTTLLEAAEPAAAGYKPQPLAADEIDREELICQVRQLFSSGGGRSREAAIKELATALGYERVGPRIREELDNAIRTAVRRGILLSQGDELRLHCRAIEDYERDFLKAQFLASLQGRTWADREEAIKGFARWLGFRRTGLSIGEMGRSLINGLIRDDRLEADGSNIRRIG